MSPTASRPERVVVIGAGMVGHRFAATLAVRDTTGRYEIHLVGEEPYEPYNRVLLSDVVAGRAAWQTLTLEALPSPVRVRTGAAARRIDRVARVVELSDDEHLPYDRLVLATGARAFVPPVPGLGSGAGSRLRHVHVLRDLDDTRAVVARVANARHAVVLGGGLLGLEAACGLRHRGLGVTVVQDAPQLMAGQVEAEPAAVLAGTVREAGIDVRTGAGLLEVLAEDGEASAVRLTDGSVVPCDLVLVSCGVRAETGLASEAGLAVERGVVVDEASRSVDDARVHAIGDCAQQVGVTAGLVATGWAQADRLAGHLLSGEAPEPVPAALSAPDLRLKAVGVHLVALGTSPAAAAPDDRVLRVDDHQAGRHVSLVVRGQELIGATVVGSPELAASLSVLLGRPGLLPVDPLELLAAPRPREETTPLRMPGSTTVCRCNDVSKTEIVRAYEGGARDVAQVARATRATTGCGGCSAVVCGLVEWLRDADPPQRAEPVPAVAPT